MTFKTVIRKNEKQLFFALVVLVLIETIFRALAAHKGIIQPHNVDYMYHVIYIILLLFWSNARCEGVSASFDKGIFYWAIYPFFIFYGCLKQFGRLKGTGVFFLFILGYLLPDITYDMVFMLRHSR